MTTPSEYSTPEERAQLLDQRRQQATTILGGVRSALQEFFKTYEVAPVRRRIMPLGNHAIYYGDFNYSATYITVRVADDDGQPYLELAGKSSTEEREALAKVVDELGKDLPVGWSVKDLSGRRSIKAVSSPASPAASASRLPFRPAPTIARSKRSLCIAPR